MSQVRGVRRAKSTSDSGQKQEGRGARSIFLSISFQVSVYFYFRGKRKRGALALPGTLFLGTLIKLLLLGNFREPLQPAASL